MINKIRLIIFLFPLFCVSQTFSGTVIDKSTQKPIETVAVYFDNTTIGTTTNENGRFLIEYSDAIQSALVISYLGYEKVFITDYRSQNNSIIELIDADNELDEVYINYDDGLTRKQKLRIFRKEFLGTSKFGKSCDILNEDDLILRYDKKNKALYANSEVPLRVINKALQYEVDFDIIDFEINYRYVDLKKMAFTINSVTYLGTSFYKDLEKADKKKTIKNREIAYKGSIQHFMRSLFNKKLNQEDYKIFHGSFRVHEWDYFKIEFIRDSDIKKVKLDKKVSILYKNSLQSQLELTIDEFYVDTYGNYSPIVGVLFGGHMGDLRLGDTLPLNYGLSE